MIDPNSPNANAEHDALADWDGGQPDGVNVQPDGHVTVYGTVDGQNMHVSYNQPGSDAENQNGSNVHSTIGYDKDFGSKWIVNHETGEEN